MATAERKDPSDASDFRLTPEELLGEEEGPKIRRPDEDIAHRPRLKAKPVGSRSEDGAPRPTVRSGALFRQSDQEPDAEPPKAQRAARPLHELPKRVVEPLPDPACRTAGGEGDSRYAYATYRSAPADEAAEEEELRVVTGARKEREVSAGFLLGVAFIVVVLIGGIWMARLSRKVSALETHVNAIADVELRMTAAAEP